MTTKNIRVLLVDEGLAGMISVPMEAYFQFTFVMSERLEIFEDDFAHIGVPTSDGILAQRRSSILPNSAHDPDLYEQP